MKHIQHILMEERRTLRMLYNYYSTTCHPTVHEHGHATPDAHGHSHSHSNRSTLVSTPISHNTHVDNHIVIQGISFESIELFVKTFELFPHPNLIPNLDALRELFRQSVTKYTWLEYDTKDWDPNTELSIADISGSVRNIEDLVIHIADHDELTMNANANRNSWIDHSLKHQLILQSHLSFQQVFLIISVIIIIDIDVCILVCGFSIKLKLCVL